MTRAWIMFGGLLLSTASTACQPADRDAVAETGLGSSGASGGASSDGGSGGMGSDGPTDSTAGGDPSGGDSTGGPPGDTADPDGDGTGDGGTGGIRLDVAGGNPETGGGEGSDGEGCRGLDFLFVVDNSGSMRNNQVNLINSFPGFVDTIGRKVAESARNFHLMVTDTDAVTGCYNFCPNIGANGTCNNVSCAEIPGPPADPCETTLGAGRLTNGYFEPCGVTGSGRFMDGGQPDFEETFSCLAEVGVFADGSEQPAGSVVSALSPALTGAGQCNEGFLRDDTILVVVFITDDADEDSPGVPQQWYQDVLAARGGDETAIVMVGIIAEAPACPPEGGAPKPELAEFVSLFGDRGVVGSVCDPDYSPTFERAVDVIDQACEDFVPPG